MSKIIKITESQLRRLIDKQINEQNNPQEDGTYMTLSNLVMIKDYIETILKYKHQTDFSKLVTGEHAWAGDHIATAKDDIQEVANFVEAYFEKDQISESSEEIDESKNKPTKPELWSRAKSLAKSKFKVYPSAYANGWASKWYKSHGGGWRKSKK